MTATLARGLSPVRHRLGNGAVLLAQTTGIAPAVTISATFEAGTMYDASSCPGAAQVVARMLDRGTERWSGAEIADALDSRGVSLGVSVSRHLLSLSATCLTEDFDDVLDLLVEVARRPTFPETEIAVRRAERVTEIRQDEDNPYVRAAEAVSAVLYGPLHPYGRPARGSVAAVERITRADLVEFHARRMRPSSLCLAIVGDVPEERAIERAALALEDWTALPAEFVPVPPPEGPRARVRMTVPMPGKPQADIACGFTAVRRLDPRYYACWIMNNVLGEFGLGGRLAASLRERQGLAYYAFSSFDAMVGEAPLLIRAGVDPGHVGQALELIEAEVRRMSLAGPDAAEVEESREYLIGSIPRLLETDRSIAELLQFEERFGLGLDYDRQLPGLLSAVTLDDVRAAAADILDPDRLVVAVAGPPDA